MKKERKTGVFEIISVFWLILAYGLNIVYAALNAETLLDSDMASEMILSNILNQERSVTGLTDQWIYSTELRVFETQWIYRIGLFFSPHNWHFARVISIALFLILLSFCVIVLFKAADLTNYSAFAAALCLMPMGGWYFWQTLFGSYYMPYIYISLLTVALMMLISKESSTLRKAVYFVLISFLGIASGLNGVKQLMVFGAPFVISTFLLCLYEIRQDKNHDNKKELMQTFSDLGIAVSHCAFSLAGYIINSKVLADKYYFKQFNDTEIWGKSIWEYVRYYIWSFGYAEGKKIRFASRGELPCIRAKQICRGIILKADGDVLSCRYRHTEIALSGKDRYEKDDTLKLGLAVRDKLQALGFKVAMSRTEDELVDRTERGKMANKAGAVFFVSIHRNKADGGGHGVEGFIPKGDDKESRLLGENIMHFLGRAGFTERTIRAGTLVDPNDDYEEIAATDMPSALIEVGFLSSEDDNYRFDAHMDQNASAIANAINYTFMQLHEPEAAAEYEEFLTQLDNTCEKVINATGEALSGLQDSLSGAEEGSGEGIDPQA